MIVCSLRLRCLNLSSLGRHQIPYEEISNIEEIKKGSQGVVYKGVFGGRTIALKKFAKKREADYHLLLLDHPNLIKFLLVIRIYCFPCKQSKNFLFFKGH